MVEREPGSNSVKQPKLPFSETQRVYREGVENLIRPMLEDPESELSQKLEEGEPAFVDTGVYSAKRGKKRLIPVVLPLDYYSGDSPPGGVHNSTQLYLFNDDFWLSDVAGFNRLDENSVLISVRRAVEDVLPFSYRESYAVKLRYSKPGDISLVVGADIVEQIRELVEQGKSYDELRKEGFSSSQMSYARERLSTGERSVVVPKSENWRSWKETIANLEDPKIDRSKKRRLIAQIPWNISQRYSRQAGDRRLVFEDLQGVVLEADLNTGQLNHYAGYLKAEGLPVGHDELVVLSGAQKGRVHRYTFILHSDHDEILRLLMRIKNGEVIIASQQS